MYFIEDSTPRSVSNISNMLSGNIRNSSPIQIQIGEVVSINDPFALGLIQVRIKGSQSNGGDDGLLDGQLPDCFPIIPKLISTQPQIGEAVFIFIFGNNSQHVNRMYIGPIISQPQLLSNDPFYNSALAGFTFGVQTPNTSVFQIPELTGVFPNQQDVSIQGRYNTDITQKNNEIVIRAGKFVTSTPTQANPYPFSFNNSTQAYIQIKNDVIIQPQTDSQPQQKGTVLNLVGNKINILTHANGNPRFNLTDPTDLITDDDLANILANAHPLPFGDVLIQYLKLLKDAFLSHVHNGSGNKPTDLTTGDKLALSIFKSKAEDLENAMLSANIKIN